MSSVLTSEGLNGFTFDVDDVDKASNLKPSVKTKAAAEKLLGFKVEACSDYSDDCVAEVTTHPLVTAVADAYAEHRPLVLSPDCIWTTVLHGLADHLEFTKGQYDHLIIANETHRHVAILDTSDCHTGSLESAWDEIVDNATVQTREWIRPEFHSLFDLEFTTTKTTDRIAKRIALLSVVKKFVVYLEGWICGIPQITLEGEVEDWTQMRDSIDMLRPFEFDWWLDPISEILDEFVTAASGKPNREFWQRICTYEEVETCLKGTVSGWIGKLFPYEFRKHQPYRRNQMFESKSHLVGLDRFPTGVKEIPLKMANGSVVRLLGGFIGVSQNAETLHLKPKIGWSVRRQSASELLLDEVANSPRCEVAEAKSNIDAGSKDMAEFYDRFEAVEVLNHQGSRLVRFKPPQEIKNHERSDDDNSLIIFAELNDGRLLGRKMFYTATPPHERNAYFVVESQQSEFGSLISNDFQQVLRWVLNKQGDPLMDLPEVKVVAEFAVKDLQTFALKDENTLKIIEALDSLS